VTRDPAPTLPHQFFQQRFNYLEQGARYPLPSSLKSLAEAIPLRTSSSLPGRKKPKSTFVHISHKNAFGGKDYRDLSLITRGISTKTYQTSTKVSDASRV